MSLSAERMAIANRAIQQTFEQASIAWQVVPHWDTGDPGQVRVRNDVTFAITEATTPLIPESAEIPLGVEPLELKPLHISFQMTLAQTTATTPDALLAGVLPRTVELAREFDKSVLTKLKGPAATARPGGNASPWYPTLATGTDGIGKILKALINGRQLLEDSGYRAPSCLIASTAHFTDLHQVVGSRLATGGLLVGGNVNSLHRATQLDGTVADGGAATASLMLMLGRRQQIAQGYACAASPGEEPVDLAISVPPSLEVIGENAAGAIELAVRIRFATRVKDERGVVVFHT